MSLNAIFEISVILERFRNIDLSQQGLYQLEVSCFYLENTTKVKAQPVSLESFRTSQVKASLHNIVQGSINEENLSIKSRVFFIRFSEEKVKLNELVTFHLEIELNKSYSESPLFIQTDLYHSEFSKKRSLETLKSGSYENALSLVSTNRFKVGNPMQGVYEHLPICFRNQWFCIVDSIVLIAFYDYKIPSCDLNLFTNILFSDKNGHCSSFIGGQQIDRKYSEYVSTLAQVHENLRKIMEKISLNCFIEDIETPKCLQLPVTFPNPNPNKTFAEHLSTHESAPTAQQILNEIKSIGASIYEAFNMFKCIIVTKPRKVCKYLKKKYSDRLMQRFGEFVIKEVNQRWEFEICSVENTKEQHKEYVKKMRGNTYYKHLDLLAVQEEFVFPKISSQPVIFEEIYYSEEIEKVIEDSTSRVHPDMRKREDKHLIVLVHGFQGNSFDLRSLHNFISLAYPHCYFLESTYNETKTDGDIREMGLRLSKELISYLTENFPDKPPSISFIGHSLGGLIIRAALPLVECLSDRMHMYMSLSSPHLGFMYSSKLLDAGMWLLKKVKKNQCLKQLCLEDYHKTEGTCLYLLSKADGLQWFQYVVLVSSSQDEYAPFGSARIEVPEKASKDPEMGNYYIQMAHNLLQKFTMQNLIKFDVHFKLDKSIDSMIGRSAHMQLLENSDFLKMLVYRYPEFFA